MQDTDKSVESASKVLLSLSNKGIPMNHDISKTHLPGTVQRIIYVKLPAEDRQKFDEGKVG